MRWYGTIGLLICLGCRDKEINLDTTVDTQLDTQVDTAAQDSDGDGFTPEAGDCDDADASVHPEAPEVCDDIDNNCDGVIDTDATDLATWYTDADGDGHGDPTLGSDSCEAPDGAVPNGDDCDDANPAIHPDALEYDCTDPVDYNCDGSVGYADADGDGHPACEDCDDADANANDDQDETCDGIDNDCDGDIDDNPTDATTFYIDADGDGYGDDWLTQDACAQPTGFVTNTDDCDDLNGDSYLGADETCDGADNDCDGDIDEGVQHTWYADADGDGYGDSTSTSDACNLPPGYTSNGDDCDDADPSAHPGSFEVCDTVDNDCDGSIDEDDAINASAWYADTDGDGYGDATSITTSCSLPSGHVGNNADCNDGNAGISPSANETCDSVDNDCDGTTDEDDAIDAGTWYADADADGHGNPNSTTNACAQPGGYVPSSDDCDDGTSSINPSATETWYDGVDQDCDGRDDDQDGDSLLLADDCNDTDATSTAIADDADCDGSLTADDCNDSDAAVYPDANGVCSLGASCLAILNAGLSTGDTYYDLDLDGPDNGTDPFAVECDMTNGGWTVFHHDGEAQYTVQGIETCHSGGHSQTLTYTVDESIITTLLAAATDAQQHLYKDCKGSGIWPSQGSCSWWEDLAGDQITSYWPGGSSACDTNDYTWRANGGYITDPADLPIKTVYTGDTGDSGEEAKITIGPLMVK